MLRELITVNPRSIQSNPRKKGKRKHRAKLRRNPRFGLPSIKSIVSTASESVLPAAIGGAGALGVDIAIGWATFIPPEWKLGTRRTLLRAGTALALGVVARMFLPQRFKKLADQATAGALTVTAYDVAKGFVAEQWPQLTLGMYDGDLSAYTQTSYDALPTLRNGVNGVGVYVPAGSNLGFIPAAR